MPNVYVVLDPMNTENPIKFVCTEDFLTMEQLTVLFPSPYTIHSKTLRGVDKDEPN